MVPRWLEQLYRTLNTVLSAVLLTLYLVCLIDGALRLSLYDDLSGVGLMLLGVALYFGGALSLEESHPRVLQKLELLNRPPH